MFVRLQIEDLYGGLFLRGNEEPMAFDVDSKMIPFARKARDGNCLCEAKRRLFLSLRHGPNQRQCQNYEEFFHGLTPIVRVRYELHVTTYAPTSVKPDHSHGLEWLGA